MRPCWQNVETVIFQTKTIAFYSACQFDQKDVVKVILEHSNSTIDLNARANNGVTAFMISGILERKDIVKLLLEYSEVRGIDISESEGLGPMMKCNKCDIKQNVYENLNAQY